MFEITTYFSYVTVNDLRSIQMRYLIGGSFPHFSQECFEYSSKYNIPYPVYQNATSSLVLKVVSKVTCLVT